MKPADFLLLFAICLVWALNLVFTRWTVTTGEVPPVFFGAIRLTILTVVLLPFLLPGPRQLGLMFIIAMGLGAGQFALLFTGLANASASAAAVIGQLGVPFATLLSMLVLGERVGWVRGAGIVMSFAGAVIIAVDPEHFSLTLGLVYLVGAAFIGAVANIVMKRIEPMPAMRLQAWVGLMSIIPLLVLTGFTEKRQIAPYLAGDWRIYASTAFAVLGVSIFAHGNFYGLIKRYDVSLLAPLTLMTPVLGVILSIVLLGEPMTSKLLIGAVVALTGVAIIILRGNRRFPEAAVGDKIGP